MNKRFIIVGTQRTGSSALAEMVTFHPNIVCGWEWTQKAFLFNKITKANKALKGDFTTLPIKHRVYMKKYYNSSIEWIGYRRLFRASSKWIINPKFSIGLIPDRFNGHLNWIRNDTNIHIIHIIRRTNIDWLKSVYLARASKSYIGESYKKDLRVKISVTRAIKRIKSKKYIDSRLHSLSKSNPYLSIYYEDIWKDKQKTIDSIFQFFGYSKFDVSKNEQKTKKQSTLATHEYIENYDEIFELLNNNNLLYS
jgi:hypothetical protein